MRIMHLSDLHIGKSLNEVSMQEDQAYVFEQVISVIEKKQVDAVIIAGDVWDRSVPAENAVQLWSTFLCSLVKTGKQIFIISGNHDSSKRLDYASPILDAMNIHLYAEYDGTVHSYDMQDEYGTVRFHLVPFIKPPMVRRYFAETEIKTYNDAFAAALSNTEIDKNIRNIIIAHQYVTSGEFSPERCESELESIGGLDNINASLFDDFDYAALGHLHRAQCVGRDTIRYCGTLLKYSASEACDKKSVTIIDIKEKGAEIEIERIPILPLHNLIRIEGKLEDILNEYGNKNHEEYAFVTLTDEDDLIEPRARLRTVFKNLMNLQLKRTFAGDYSVQEIEDYEGLSPLELFDKFFQRQNNKPMSDLQAEIVRKLFSDLGEGD